MTLNKFYDLLETHDWYYGYSDDHRVYSAGNAKGRELQGIAEALGQSAKDLYSAFSGHYFSGAAFGTPKQPKPERPQEGQ